MAGKFRRALTAIGDGLETYAEYSKEVDDMTNELMRRTYDLDVAAAKKVAKTLVSQANVTWNNSKS